MDTKKCKRCNEVKPISEFYGSEIKIDTSCKECRKYAVRQYRMSNLDKIRTYDRDRGKTKQRKDRTVINTRNRRKDPDGYMAAHNAVARSLRNGVIERLPCCMCGTLENIHAHHDDYSNPLSVMWLCVIHHKSRHAFLEYINEDIF